METHLETHQCNGCKIELAAVRDHLMDPNGKQVVIVVKGGTVQGVYANFTGTDALVVDWDNIECASYKDQADIHDTITASYGPIL